MSKRELVKRLSKLKGRFNQGRKGLITAANNIRKGKPRRGNGKVTGRSIKRS